ncbi:MAG: glycosyltransferase family 2 protein [Blautia sp.]|nr:glycosyltransferase family 2 protein [Blautia sp.]
MKYSIVIPCYNESENLKRLLQSIMPLTEKHDIEFVLVENGSTDDSRTKFETLQEMRDKHIIRVYVDKNQGYGYGVQQGLKACSGDYVGWIHADMQIKPRELAVFMRYIDRHGADCPLFVKGKRSNRSLFDRFFTGAMSVFETVLFGVNLYDIGAIPVLFPKELLKNCTKMPYDFSIELYVYLQAKKNHYIIKRHKVRLRKRVRGMSSWDKGLASKIKQSKRIIKDSIQIKKGEQVF